MTDERLTVKAHMNGLMAQLGGPVAVAALMEARLNRPYSAGTLSQKKNGHADWTIMDMIVLQEAAGRAPVTDWLVSLDDDPQRAITREAAAMRIAVESGELVAALIDASSPEKRAKALKELADVREAIEDAEDALEGQR
ncbi:hypothetical protein [Falsirhodobacter sp. 20TX0035]|uniref:hypothetical protein n=1 Tax=Falsirhodobacter sp. 20TX0035 TaxID=3022019 RepID=UPI00232F8C7F|nr:hypothetical protein [Falsirhodobacter sp. 20TX0035]MDB6454473.1 hypothetical protein [Falsirhodobacter sp. 20TX0035]